MRRIRVRLVKRPTKAKKNPTKRRNPATRRNPSGAMDMGPIVALAGAGALAYSGMFGEGVKQSIRGLFGRKDAAPAGGGTSGGGMTGGGATTPAATTPEPAITLTSPIDGTTVRDLLTVHGSTNFPISKVQVVINGTWAVDAQRNGLSFAATVPLLSAYRLGTHRVIVRATHAETGHEYSTPARTFVFR